MEFVVGLCSVQGCLLLSSLCRSTLCHHFASFRLTCLITLLRYRPRLLLGHGMMVVSGCSLLDIDMHADLIDIDSLFRMSLVCCMPSESKSRGHLVSRS
jgi:hypothetical protein